MIKENTVCIPAQGLCQMQTVFLVNARICVRGCRKCKRSTAGLANLHWYQQYAPYCTKQLDIESYKNTTLNNGVSLNPFRIKRAPFYYNKLAR